MTDTKPAEVAPDDEALIDAFAKDAVQFGNAIWSADKRAAAQKSREALRRHIAGLRAEIADWELNHTKIGLEEAIEQRALKAEAALAACRAAGDLLYAALVDNDEEGLVEAAEPMRKWRALKNKEPKHVETWAHNSDGGSSG